MEVTPVPGTRYFKCPLCERHWQEESEDANSLGVSMCPDGCHVLVGPQKCEPKPFIAGVTSDRKED